MAATASRTKKAATKLNRSKKVTRKKTKAKKTFKAVVPRPKKVTAPAPAHAPVSPTQEGLAIVQSDRQKQLNREAFVEKILPKLKKKVKDVSFDKSNGSYSFNTRYDGKTVGVVYYPTVQRLFIRETNTWVNRGLEWLMDNVMA